MLSKRWLTESILSPWDSHCPPFQTELITLRRFFWKERLHPVRKTLVKLQIFGSPTIQKFPKMQGMLGFNPVVRDSRVGNLKSPCSRDSNPRTPPSVRQRQLSY